MMRPYRLLLVIAVALLVVWRAGPSHGQVPGYADLFDPLRVLNLNIELHPDDWNTIRNDDTYSIELPGYFWADGENKLIVGVRRKPTDAHGDKVSLKIDVNEYFDNLQWRGVKKLSLENGYDVSPVAEGLAWYLHRAAAGTMDGRYQPPLAAWVNVTVNGQLLGLYTNVEQVDKRFLRNQDLWIDDATWLYKQGEKGPAELRLGDGDSPIFTALYYKPFNPSGPVPPAGYEVQVAELIDMEQMLTVGAINAFTANLDELLSKGKNFFFADYSPGAAGGQRLYFPWDLDAVFTGQADASIYTGRRGDLSDYQRYILGVPEFRDQYNQIMLDLLDGPLAVASLHGFLDELETALTPSLQADPYDPGDVAGLFNNLRGWITARHANVLWQVQEDMGATGALLVPEPSAAASLMAAALAVLLARRPRRASRRRSLDS
jgi:spore coat protein CotH